MDESMFLNSDIMFNTLTKILETVPKGTEIEIASYGLYADVSKGEDWSLKYGKSEQRKFLEKAMEVNPNTKVLIGVPYFMECKENCKECREQYNSRALRIEDTFRKIYIPKGRYHAESHLKYYRIGDRVWIGGINMTGSAWVDVVIEVKEPKQIRELQSIFKDHYKTGTLRIKEYLKEVPHE